MRVHGRTGDRLMEATVRPAAPSGTVTLGARLIRLFAPSRGYALLCLVAGALTAGLTMCLVSGLGGPKVSQTLSNVALCVAALLAALSCLAKARQSARRTRGAWALIG